MLKGDNPGNKARAALLMRFTQEDEGVSPVIATILIMTIMLTVITSIMFWGNFLILDMQDNANYSSFLNYMKDINSGVRDVAEGGLGTSRSVYYSIPQGSIGVEPDTSLWAVSYGHYNNDSVKFSDIEDNSFNITTMGNADTARIYWSDSDMTNWWDDSSSTWQYRVPVTVNSGESYRMDEVVTTNVNFQQILDRFGAEYGLDPSSIRVVEYDDEGNIIGEVPAEGYGIDYATTVLHDTWDMENSGDIANYGGITNPVFSGGQASFTTSVNSGFVCPLFMTDNIETPFYTNLAIRMYSSADSDEGIAVMWENTVTGQVSQTRPIATESGWNLYTIDLSDADLLPAGYSTRNGRVATGERWTDMSPNILYIFPINQSGVSISIDEIYLYKSAAAVKFLMPGVTPPNTDREFMIYFDTLDNGPKESDLDWAVYNSNMHYFSNKDSGINITFNGNSPVLTSIKKGSISEVDAYTADIYQYMCNIVGTGINPPSTLSVAPTFHITNMYAVLEFNNLQLSSSLYANMSYEMIKGSPYVFLHLDMWATSDIITPVSMQFPLIMTDNGLEYTFYRDLYGNVSQMLSGGDIYTLYNERWAQMYGPGVSNLQVLYLEDESTDANNLTMVTQNRDIIYDDQDPGRFLEKWGSDGFQGSTSGAERYSGVRSFVIDAGTTDAWQPGYVDTSTYNYFSFAYKKSSPTAYIYIRFYVNGNWHEITDDGTLTADYDGWTIPHITDTNWHQVIIDLNAETTNGADESPFGVITHEAPNRGGFLLGATGTGVVYYDAIYFQEDSVNTLNGLSWNRYKSVWPQDEHEKRTLAISTSNYGTNVQPIIRKWASANTPMLPFSVDITEAENVKSRFYQLTTNPGTMTVNSITTDIPLSEGAHVTVWDDGVLVKEMYVYGIDELHGRVDTTRGVSYIKSVNGGIVTGYPTTSVAVSPAVLMNSEANSLIVHMIEMESSDVSSIGKGDYVCSISSTAQYNILSQNVFFVRIYISGDVADAFYDNLVTTYSASIQAQYASESDSFVPSSYGGEEFKYGILLMSQDVKGTPEDEGAYSLSIMHTTVDVNLIEKRL